MASNNLLLGIVHIPQIPAVCVCESQRSVPARWEA
uniref:Uncharacterized protein n=1 Tax=Anguilla anguilla TaxID=7936 RepID=A0A0E9RGW9_ANGAN